MSFTVPYLQPSTIPNGNFTALKPSLSGQKFRATNRFNYESKLFSLNRKAIRQLGRNNHKSLIVKTNTRHFLRCCDSSSISPDLAPEPVYDSSREPYSSLSEPPLLNNANSKEEEIIVGSSPWTPPSPGNASLESSNQSPQQDSENFDGVDQSPTVRALAKAGIEIVESLKQAESEALKAMQKAEDLPGPVFEKEPYLFDEIEKEKQQIRDKDAQKVLLVGMDDDDVSSLESVLDKKGLISVEADKWEPGSLSPASEIATRLIISEVAERLSIADVEKVEIASSSPSIVVPNLPSVGEEEEGTTCTLLEDSTISSLGSVTMDQPTVVPVRENIVKKDLTILEQMKVILGFAGPALVIWLSAPLMSLIDTAVIGQSSSLELAALGPGTVVCDHISNLFMFLSVATSNLIATSMAHKDVEEAGRHLSRLLFVALSCGIFMTIFTHYCAPAMIRGFVGSNLSVIPAAKTYAAIRGLAWPAVLITSVAQSASLGMQDAWGPLYVLVTASLINLFGDIILCSYMGMGIAGAAWATMASQYVGCILMLWGIHRARAIKLSMSIPSPKDLKLFMQLAAPILLTMLSKTSFYTVLTKVATSLGTVPSGAHQVMIGLFAVCAVCGEPLSQTAQSYLPALKTGKDRNLKQARLLLKSLLIFGVIMGLIVGGIAAVVPWAAPNLFTQDAAVIAEMRKIAAPLHMSLLLTPIVLSLEGTLLAGRDFAFLAKSMVASLVGCVGIVLVGQMLGMGLVANWWTLVCFQSVRMIQAGLRLTSSKSILNEDDYSGEPEKEPLLA